MTRPRAVVSSGLSIAVREHGRPGPGRETVVLVHGYPDQQRMWDLVVAALPTDDLHVVTYDVRGAGASGVPRRRRDYRAERLVDDLVAVLDAVLPPGRRAHLVGHDWGSVQLWDAVVAEADDARLRGRIASFTSISGPSLDHAGRLLRRSRGRRLALLGQLLHSWYVFALHVPVLPGWVWRRLHRPLARAIARREGLPSGHWGPELGRDAANGLNLYRANVVPRMTSPRVAHTDVPVLVVRPTRDAFIKPVLLDELDEVCSEVRVVEVDAGHWVPRTHPTLVAALVVDQVRRTASAADA